MPMPSSPSELIGCTTFWGALLLLAYVYVGYPALTWLRSRRVRVPLPNAAATPTVSIVVAAHNEGDRIAARIQNLLALDYPAGQLEILVGSDGSTDDTVPEAARFLDVGVRLLAFSRWRGKPSVLNALVASAGGDIVLFADARQRFDPGVVRTLVAHFSDPTVGAVSGELMLADTGSAIGRGAGFYWRYEKFIRKCESRLGSTVGATGAIYAIRRALFEPLPADTILDDVLVPMRIVRSGYQVRFDPNARAFDTASATAGQEHARKVRTIAGMFQLLAREPWLLHPGRNPLWFATLSHKVLRLTLPALHAALLLGPLAALESHPIYPAAVAGQIAFYGAAVAGWRYRQSRLRVLTVPYTTCVLLWATLVAFARFLRHREGTTWERRTPLGRPVPPSQSR